MSKAINIGLRHDFPLLVVFKYDLLLYMTNFNAFHFILYFFYSFLNQFLYSPAFIFLDNSSLVTLVYSSLFLYLTSNFNCSISALLQNKKSFPIIRILCNAFKVF